MKKLKDSGLMKFIKKAGNTVSDVLNVGTKLASGNVLGAVAEAKEILTNSNHDSSDTLLAELEVNQDTWIDEAVKLFELEERSRERASNLYSQSKEVTNKLASNIMKFNLWYALGLLIINVTVALFAQSYEIDQNITLVTTNMITFIIRGLLDERKDVISFFFGGSVGKDEPDNEDLK
jgi:hypothetical protein